MKIKLPTPQDPLRIGTRGSPLALAQAHETRNRLAQAFDLPQEAFEIVVISVTGDQIQHKALKEIGGKGLFTKEIEEDLLDERIHLAVHSSKDMPTEQPPGLILDTFLPREDVRDAFISPSLSSIQDLAEGAVVGTSSLRRKAQLLHKRPDLQVVEFRGNVQTRLRKLSEGVAECTFLACAGLSRLGMDEVPSTPIAPEDMLPAVAQGAIGIERRETDSNTGALLEAIHDAATGQRVACERAFLFTLDGSCETPIAGLADLNGDTIRLRGEILRPDGSEAIADSIEGPVSDGPAMGKALGERLLGQASPDFFDWR